MKKTIAPPRMVAFEVTHRCASHCRHCRAGASASGDGDLTTEQCRQILAGLARYRRAVVILTGGEPLEREDVYELLAYGRSLGHRMAMATCGYPIDAESLQRLKELEVLSLSFSLDGLDAHAHDCFRGVSGAYDTVVRAMELARAAGVRFQINTAVTRSNVDQVPDLARWAQDQGAFCFSPFILVPTGRGSDLMAEMLTPDRYEALLNQLHQLQHKLRIDIRLNCGPQFARVMSGGGGTRGRGCRAGYEYAFIDVRGDLKTCGFLPLSAGSLLEHEFGDLWEHSTLMRQVRDRSQLQGTCGACDSVEVCGGCRARAYALTGELMGSDPLCALVGTNLFGFYKGKK